MDLVAMLPWWAGVALAVLSYLLLHPIATAPLPTATAPEGISQLFVGSLWHALAYFGQFFLPLICIAGAMVSLLRRRKRRALLESVSTSKATDTLDGITWQEFELLVGEGFRRQGYTVTETGGGGADGGVDLVLSKTGEKFLVQCKQWRALKVGVTVVRELFGVMAARGATGGFVVTSGRFTDEARAFSKGRNIELLDGPELLKLIRQGSSSQAPIDAPPYGALRPAEAPPANDAPACPVCGHSMVRRVAKRGAPAGNAFWGCSTYPKCKGTRPL